MSVSILSHIPSAEHAAIAARTSTYDCAANFQSAIDALHAQGGGTLYIPAGKYRLNSTITNKIRVNLLGDGTTATMLEWGPAHNGHGIQQLAALNSGTQVENRIEHIGLMSLAGQANGGGAFYERGGTQVKLRDCQFRFFKYGVILDQSELVDILECDFASNYHSCVWMVNGPEAALGNVGAAGGYTNRISVTRCQLNEPGEFCILDDGGYSHSLIDNNYNGGPVQIRAAGVQGFVIQGSYFESATFSNIYLTNIKSSGGGAGPSAAVLVAGNYIAPAYNNHCVELASVGRVTLVGNFFRHNGTTTRGAVACWQSNMVFSMGNYIEAGRKMFEGSTYVVRWSGEALRDGSATADVGSIPAGGSAFVDMTVTDAAVGDWVAQVSASVDLGDHITLSGRVTAADTVRVKLTNTGPFSVNPPSCTYGARIERKQI